MWDLRGRFPARVYISCWAAASSVQTILLVFLSISSTMLLVFLSESFQNGNTLKRAITILNRTLIQTQFFKSPLRFRFGNIC